MEIGGIDTELESCYPPHASALLVLGYLYVNYPKGCHENADVEPIEKDDRKEFFFYTSYESKQSWDNDNHQEDGFGKEMIYIIAEKGQVTIVHERDDIDFAKIEKLLCN